MGQEMSDVPRQPPPKKEVALALLEESSMFIHLDPRRPDVLVPKGFMGQPQLVLQVGLNMAIPIPDLKIDEGGISCTLSFNRSPFWCRIPWSAIYALVGEDGRGGVWTDDVPPEVQQQKPAAPSKATPAKKARPKLTAVGAADRADRNRPRDDADKNAKPTASPRGLSAVPDPERDARPAASSDDGILEAEPTKLVTSPPTPQPPAQPATAEDGQAAHPSQPPGKKSKREIPPYLRVIK
jgi:Stringent starvation protein B